MIQMSDILIVSDALSAIRYSIEYYMSSRGADRADAEKFYLRIEMMRIRFVSRIESNRIIREGDIRKAEDSVQVLWADIDEILNDEYCRSLLGKIILMRTIRPPLPRRAPAHTMLLSRFERFQDRENRLPIIEVFLTLHDHLEGGVENGGITSEEFVDIYRNKDVSDRLRKIVPEQKVAPIQFDITSGVISISRNTSELDPNGAVGAINARDVLTRRGQELIEGLQNSNCDRRLVDSYKLLQDELESSGNIIRLGIANIGAGTLAKAFDRELPTAILALMHAHTIGINMYISQYPDWIRFSENAASANISKKDYSDIKQILGELIENIDENTEISDPEVPISLKYLHELINVPGKSGVRATFAAIRTLENLVSRIFSYGIEFIDSVARQTVTKGSGAASNLLVGSLLALGITVASQLTPLAGKIDGMSWIKDATEIIRKQLNEFK